MARIVLDTNSLIQCLPSRSRYHAVWQSFERGENTLCVSNEILEEYTEILQRLTSNEVAEHFIKMIVNSPFVEFRNTFFAFHLIEADPDDNKFVDCCIEAQAHCIVTNDHHYDILAHIPFPKVLVLSLADFYREIILEGKEY